MAASSREIILMAILLNCCFTVFTKVETKLIRPTDVEEPNDMDEDDDSGEIFPQNLQNNYQNGFLRIIEFFKSTNSNLEKINARLARLEKSDGVIQTTLRLLKDSDAEIKQKLKLLEMSDREIKQKLLLLEQENRSNDLTLKALHPGYEDLRVNAYLASLSQPVKGSSFKGSTTESIAAAIPETYAYAIEIANYLDGSLTDYQLYDPHKYVTEVNKAPATIFSKTRQILTFKDIKEDGLYPAGLISYRIGDTGFSLHLFFYSHDSNGVGLLDNTASVRTLWKVVTGCPNYNYPGTLESFRCFQKDGWDTTKTFFIHKDTIYAKVTVNFTEKTTIYKVEIFNYQP